MPVIPENGDPFGTVNKGTADTGVAVVLPGRPEDPVGTFMGYKNQADAQYAKRQSDMKTGLGTAMKGADDSFKAWDIDVQREIAPQVAKYKQLLGLWYKNGLDPQNPLSQVYGIDQQIKNKLQMTTDASKAHQKIYEDAVGQLNKADAGKYDLNASRDALEQWRSMPLEQRMTAQVPNLIAYFDAPNYERDYMDKLNPTQTAYSGVTKDGKEIREGTDESFTPQQLDQAAQNMLANPNYKAEMEKQYMTLSEEDRKKVSLQKFVYDRLQGFDYVKQTRNTQQGPAYSAIGYGQGNARKSGERLLQIAAGLKKFNPKLFPEDYVNKTGGPIDMARTFAGMKLGDQTYRTVEKVYDTEASKRTGSPVYRDEVKVESKPSIIGGFKYEGGKLWVSDDRSINETNAQGQKVYPTNWRPLENMWTEFLEPFVKSNYSASDADQILNEMQDIYQKDYGGDITGGNFDVDKIWNKSNQPKHVPSHVKGSKPPAGVFKPK